MHTGTCQFRRNACAGKEITTIHHHQKTRGQRHQSALAFCLGKKLYSRLPYFVPGFSGAADGAAGFRPFFHSILEPSSPGPSPVHPLGRAKKQQCNNQNHNQVHRCMILSNIKPPRQSASGFSSSCNSLECSSSAQGWRNYSAAGSAKRRRDEMQLMPAGAAEVAASKRRKERRVRRAKIFLDLNFHGEKPMHSGLHQHPRASCHQKGVAIANCDFTVSGSPDWREVV